jgi:predicted transcriptional regulator
MERIIMEVPKIFESEYRFCLILWEHEPVNSTKLVALCKDQLGWSKATTYTVIRRLAERGVLKNENATVTALVSKEQVQESELEQLVEKTFEGSIPSFIAAFSRSKRLTDKEIAQLQELIDSHRG